MFCVTKDDNTDNELQIVRKDFWEDQKCELNKKKWITQRWPDGSLVKWHT